MRNSEREAGRSGHRPAVPQPTPLFRRRAWEAFQRALDPLAPPKRRRTPRLG